VDCSRRRGANRDKPKNAQSRFLIYRVLDQPGDGMRASESSGSCYYSLQRRFLNTKFFHSTGEKVSESSGNLFFLNTSDTFS